MARSSQFPPSVNPGIPKEQKPPKGWKLMKFDKILRVVERPAKLLDEIEYQLVTAKRNRGGIIHRENLIGKKILTKNQYYLRSGDFLISRRQIVHGACGIVPGWLDGAIASNEYATLLPNNDILLEYLSYYSSFAPLNGIIFLFFPFVLIRNVVSLFTQYPMPSNLSVLKRPLEHRPLHRTPQEVPISSSYFSSRQL